MPLRGRPRTQLEISAKARRELRELVRTGSCPRVRRMARMILLSAQHPNVTVAKTMKVSAETVARARRRFNELGVDGVRDALAGPGGRRVDELLVRGILSHLLPFRSTFWSTRRVANEEAVSHTTVWRIWKKHGVTGRGAPTFAAIKRRTWPERAKKRAERQHCDE